MKPKRSIEFFKTECKAKAEAEIKDHEGYKNWQQLRKEQDELGFNYKPIIIFSLRLCPNCHSRLKSKLVKETQDFAKYIIYSCTSCGYEYAY